MAGAVGACARCKKNSPSERLGRLPLPLRVGAALAFALVHGGLWAYEELKRPFCPRCRLLMGALSFGISALGLAAAVIGVYIWTTGPSKVG